MPWIDIRPPASFRYINTVLLDVVRHPADYRELAYRHLPVEGDTHPAQHPSFGAVLVEMTRQACAAIVLNCASELWSELAAYLLALEPSNQITEGTEDD